MPSLRAVMQENERQERLRRLEYARQYGIALGVRSARSFQSQKADQERHVMEEVKSKVAEERAAKAVQEEQRRAANSLRRGEGMRSAQDFSATLAARAREEKAAWGAEQTLIEARHELALQEQRLQQAANDKKAARAAELREKVRQEEANRSARVVSKVRTQPTTVSLAVADREGPPSVVALADKSQIERTKDSATAAIEFNDQRQKQLRDRQHRIAEERTKALARAAQALQEKKAQEEADRLARENEQALKQGMIEYAMRSIRPLAAHDFQEQDARRTLQASARAEKEFESTFLNGPWSADSIRKFHVGPPIVDSQVGVEGLLPAPALITSSGSVVGTNNSIASGAFSASAVASSPLLTPCSADVLLMGTPSVGLQAQPLQVMEVFPRCADADDADVSVGNNGPAPNEAAPMPTPNNKDNKEGEDNTMPDGDEDAADGDGDGDEVCQGHGALTATELSLQQRNAQFLRELALVQRRLANAKSLTAPLHASHNSSLINSSPGKNNNNNHNNINDEGRKFITHHCTVAPCEEHDSDASTSFVSSSALSGEETSQEVSPERPPKHWRGADNNNDVSISPMSTPEKDYRNSEGATDRGSKYNTNNNNNNNNNNIRIAMTAEQLKAAIQKMKMQRGDVFAAVAAQRQQPKQQQDDTAQSSITRDTDGASSTLPQEQLVAL